MHRFKKLEVYKRALSFTASIYVFSKKLPDDERYGLTSQLRRATTSIVLNIAEGSGAGTDMEFKRFLRMSLRSSYEVNSIFDIIEELKLVDLKDINNLRKSLDEISAMIAGLIKALNK